MGDSQNRFDQIRKLGSATKRAIDQGALSTGHALRKAEQAAPTVASGANGALGFLTKTLSFAGAAVALGGGALANAGQKLTRTGSELAGSQASDSGGPSLGLRVGGRAAQALGVATSLVGAAGALAGYGVHLASEAAYRKRELAGNLIGGAYGGAVGAAGDTVDAYAIDAAELARLKSRLESASKRQETAQRRRQAIIAVARRKDNRHLLFDVLTVGGLSLTDILTHPAAVPPGIERAWGLAYPQLAEHATFAEALAHADTDHVLGYVDAVKGKLFEIDYVDYLNAGHLPDGWHASLAESATQPGWDIRVVDDQGHMNELLQAKATESVAYVEQALHRYPDIDIVTTSEVHAQLVMQGMADHIRDSGISDASLTAAVQHTADAAGDHTFAWVGGSSASLALTAFSVFSDKGKSLLEKSDEFGQRSTKSVMASTAGKTVLLATHSWWIAPIAAIGTRLVWARGAAKRRQYEEMRGLVDACERAARRPQLNRNYPLPQSSRPSE